MGILSSPVNNEGGFILVTSMFMLMVLVIVGVAANTTTTVEIQVAGNERAYKTALYQSDGGVENGAEILEQNLACPVGFKDLNLANPLEPVVEDGMLIIGNARVVFLAFSQNTVTEMWYQPDMPEDTLRDIYIPYNYQETGAPHANLTVAGKSITPEGSSRLEASGYERAGKSAGSHGTHMRFHVVANYVGPGNNESTVYLQWRHVIGMEGDCNY